MARRAVDGIVVSFDAAAGWGVVAVEGRGEVAFHCTAIADGTRVIDPGRSVRCAIAPGRRGRWEAVDLIGV